MSALLAALLVLTAARPCAGADSDGWLEARMRAEAGFTALLRDPAAHRLQILVTELITDADGRQRLVAHGYRVGAEYVYPASAIKTFASVAAMRALAAIPDPPVDLDTPLALCKSRSTKRCSNTRDRSNLEGGKITLGHEIRKMQIVSDNSAFNRLYDFVGHREFGEDLQRLGFRDVHVQHRLSTRELPEARHKTPRMQLQPGRAVVDIPARASDLPAPTITDPGLRVGSAHQGPGGVIVPEPMDFADRNAAPVCALQRLQIALVAPTLAEVDLGLGAQHREFLLAAMRIDPHASQNPRFTDPAQSIDRFKPLLPGITRVLPAAQIEYVNKAGKAYGFHIENAFIRERSSGRAFFVTAAIYADHDGTVGDDKYAYADVSVPFFADLGELLARALLLPAATAPSASR